MRRPGGREAKHLRLTIAQGGGRRDRFMIKREREELIFPWPPIGEVIILQVFYYGLFYVCRSHIWVVVDIESVDQCMTVGA